MSDTNDNPRNRESSDTMDTLRRAYSAGRAVWPVVVLIALAVSAYVRTDYRITQLEEARADFAERHKASDERARQLLETLHRIDLRLEAIQTQLKYRTEKAAAGGNPGGAVAVSPE